MSISQGEQKVIEILKKEGKNFEREYIFPDLKSIRGGRPRFDFAVFDDEGNIDCLLEYDGILHFKDGNIWTSTRREFLYRQDMDVKKNSYCLARGIKLFRIPYYDYEKLNNYRDLIKSHYEVTTKWHNHIIRQELLSQFENKQRRKDF